MCVDVLFLTCEWKMDTHSTFVPFSQTTKHEGAPGTKEYQVRVVDHRGDLLSPWHDVPLAVKTDTSLVNMVAEIPRGERAKLEIATQEVGNPIMMDVTKATGEPRFYHFNSLVNYGALPQTWENPEIVDQHLGLGGDNDPLDVCELGSRVATVGEVYPVKPLGVLGLLDEGEVDWKILAIRATDPMADRLNDIDDVRTHLGGLLDEIIHWFRVYKIPDGKPENQFGFDGEPKGAEFAASVIADAHGAWQGLVETRRAETSTLYGYDTIKAVVDKPLWVEQK